jgi:3-phenylpropionate/trans-cinnamate dioxygenase ferredoxin reductase subunit
MSSSTEHFEPRPQAPHPNSAPPAIVIVGAGHGGAQLAFSLRQGGYAGPVVLVDGEGELPYQRPPLSKAYLTGALEADGLRFRAADFYAAQHIERCTGRVVQIDRAAKQVRLADGSVLGYGHLVLATGGQARQLAVPGHELAGVHSLRSLGDAQALRDALASASRVAVIGAGFIGLEFAAVAAQRGLPVTVIEALERPMARAVSPAVSQLFHAAHARAGVQWRLGDSVAALQGDAGRVTGVVCGSGDTIAADLVVCGIGMAPHVELAREAGLAVGNGIVVDEQLLTGDAAISAIGDAAEFPEAWSGQRLRLESVQAAVDQARHVAARLLGKAQPEPYRAFPWFWSDQGALKLQIAGLPALCSEFVTVGDAADDQATVLGFRAERLFAVETVNRAAEHMLARRALGAGRVLTLVEARAAGFDFKAWGRG